MRKMKAALGSMAVLWGLLGASTVQSQEVVLRAASAFAAGTAFSQSFEAFVKKVNEEGKGLVQIRIIGGPEAIPPFELGNAVSAGVVDIANVPGAFYLSRMPEADVMRLAEIPISDQRENGAWEYLNELHNKKMNVWYLARTTDDQPYHLYLTRKIDKPDLKGMTMRVSPTYMSFFQALGANVVQTPPGEVHTALERNMVQGYGWPLQGIKDLGWHEVTKYRVDPGFYRVDVNALVNLNKWKTLSEEQRNFLTEKALWLEKTQHENFEAANEKEKALQAELGIEVLKFSEEDELAWLDLARQSGWKQLASRVPADEVAKLRELLTQ